MRVLLCIVLVLSALVGIHASAIVPQQHHHEIQNLGSRIFQSMGAATASTSTSTSTSSNSNTFSNIPVSAACQNSTQTIQTNPMVIAANASVIHAGCFDFDMNNTNICQLTQTSPTSGSINCNCQPILSNTAWLYGNVSALGGQVCQISLELSMTAKGNINGQSVAVTANMKQTQQDLLVIGSQCTTQDIQNTLNVGTQMASSLVNGLSSGNGGLTLSNFNIKVSMCGVSASRSGTGTMIGVSWLTMLCVVLLSSMMMKQ